MQNIKLRNTAIAIILVFVALIPQSSKADDCVAGACCQDSVASNLDIVFLGDSNIWLAGDSCDNKQGWAAWFNMYMAPKSCLSMARSGASWSHTSETKRNLEENIAVLGDNNVIYNQVLRLFDAVDRGLQPAPSLIMISCGGNDGWFAHKRPNEFDKTVEEAFAIPEGQLMVCMPSEVLTLAEAIRYDVRMLQQHFPEAKIVLVTPTPMAKCEPELLIKISDIIEQSGRKLGAYTIRLDNIGLIDRDAELINPVDTYDGTHTTHEGADKIGFYVAQKVKEL